jgi:hypothetical protein
MKYIIPFILFLFIAQDKVFSQHNTRSWRIVDKLQLVGQCACPLFLLNINCPIEKDKGKFYMNFYFDTAYCRLSKNIINEKLYTLSYLIQDYAFKDSLQYCDTVFLFMMSVDSGNTCTEGYRDEIRQHRSLSNEQKMQRVARLLPWDATIEPDITDPSRLRMEINFDKGYGVLRPELGAFVGIDVFLANVNALLYDWVLRPAKLPYNKLIIASKRGGKVFKLNTFDFRNESYTTMYNDNIFTSTGDEPFNFIPSIDIEQFK